MRKVLCFLGLLVMYSNTLFAQSPARINIKGIICDTSGINIPLASIQLLNSNDSTLVNFTQANGNGEFEFRNIKNSSYVLMTSHVSYMPYQRFLSVSETDINDLGKIKLKLISRQLMEVVIKAARAPLKFRGDTVEYDAASFKVPPGSTVEDLLRRLPGIEVDVDGNIKSQGKDVKRVYVEGKSFFGDDPKSATKNLGAETISKVQVFDEKSEQSKLTGIEDGVKKDKAMNLSLKEEFKKGAFGKLTAAAGDQDRWAGRGNYNRFNKTRQLSFIGYSNNINQTGVNWDDLDEFRGQNNFDGYDNGDFGFGRVYYYSGDDLANSFDGRGLTKNYGGGVNYNFDNTKTKLSSSYVYNETTRTLDQTSNKETFLQNSSFKNSDTTHGKDFRGNHSIGIRLEQAIDSSNVLIAKANIKFSKSTDNNKLNSVYSDSEDVLTRILKTDNSNNLDTWNINSATIFRHRFKKKGSNIAWSGGFNTSKTDGLDNPWSLNRFFQANTYTEQMRLLSSNSNNTSSQFKSSMLLTEPLSKTIYWESFYNFNATSNVQDRLTGNAYLQNARVDSLSAYYTNNVLYNRIGTSFRYSNKGMNATVGLAAQQLQLKGNYAIRNNMPDLQNPINKTYKNWIPTVSLYYDLTASSSVYLDYIYSVNEPTISQLMPITNVNNLAYRIEGNPDLQPQRSHKLSISGYYSNHASMVSCNMGADYQSYESQIVFNQAITLVDKVGMQTVSKPENVKGGKFYSVYAQISFPVIRTKLRMNMYGTFNAGNSPTYINGIENITRNKGYYFYPYLNFTSSAKLMLSLQGSFISNNIKYSFRNELNQKIRNYTAAFNSKWQFAAKSYLESTFSYVTYKNETFGFNQSIPMLNASVRQLFGKKNRIEMRLAAFDIFNRNKSISQSGAQNYILYTTANTLGRYFLLSFSYNIRGFENKVK